MGSPRLNQFLSEAERALDSAERIETVLQRVARATVPRLADFCLIFLVRNTSVICVASAHVTRSGERLLRDLNRIYRITVANPISTVAHVVRTGRPKLRNDIGGELDAAHDVRALIHRKLGVESALVVPIGARPAVLGAISLCYARSGRRYTSHDVPRVRRLAAIVAAALQRRERAASAMPVPARRLVRLRARA